MTRLGVLADDRASEPKVCEKCGGRLYAARQCPWVVMRCVDCRASVEIRDISEQIDDPFEEDMAWMPMDRI